MPKSNKALAALNFGPDSCFAVNITGPGIETQQANSCEPSLGEYVGFVAQGESLSLQASRGSDRQLEIFYYAGGTGCPTIEKDKGLESIRAQNIYRVGVVKDLALDAPEMSIVVPIEAVSATNSLASLYSLPASCDDSRPVAGVAPRARSVVGATSQTTSGGYRLKLKILDKTNPIPVQSGSQ